MDRNFNRTNFERTSQKTMKFTALTIAAIFSLFGQTVAEPFPQTGTAILPCPTQTFHCRPPFIIFQSMCQLFTDFEGGGPCVS